MTNIRTSGLFPEELPEIHYHCSRASLNALFVDRVLTYQAFASIEEDKGFLKPEMSLSSSEGQEAVRILTQRGFEELAEAYESYDRDHYLEELIDAINYFWVLAIIDPEAPVDEIVNCMAHAVMNHVHEYNNYTRISLSDIGATVLQANAIFEKLRHRAWMVNAQSAYFDGWSEICHFLGENLCLVLDQFKDYQEFVRFYIAKDNVLQFRIKTKY